MIAAQVFAISCDQEATTRRASPRGPLRPLMPEAGGIRWICHTDNPARTQSDIFTR